jgi:hypothetical protein
VVVFLVRALFFAAFVTTAAAITATEIRFPHLFFFFFLLLPLVPALAGPLHSLGHGSVLRVLPCDESGNLVFVECAQVDLEGDYTLKERRGGPGAGGTGGLALSVVAGCRLRGCVRGGGGGGGGGGGRFAARVAVAARRRRTGRSLALLTPAPSVPIAIIVIIVIIVTIIIVIVVAIHHTDPATIIHGALPTPSTFTLPTLSASPTVTCTSTFLITIHQSTPRTIVCASLLLISPLIGQQEATFTHRLEPDVLPCLLLISGCTTLSRQVILSASDEVARRHTCTVRACSPCFCRHSVLGRVLFGYGVSLSPHMRFPA